jgi:hypothetical protein
MLAANELGSRADRRQRGDETELSRTVESAFKGSIFGLVALLLGFSFCKAAGNLGARVGVVGRMALGHRLRSKRVDPRPEGAE